MCWKCGEKSSPGRAIGFHDRCPACGADLHVCRNCAFYRPGSYGDCAENVVEAVVDKEKSNWCEWFRQGDPGASAKRGDDRAREAKSGFESLFS